MPQYTLQYVYQLSDFLTTGGNIAPPNEAGAQAAGTPPFNITLDANAGPQQITVQDDTDFGLDEINFAGQELIDPITLDGVLYPAGTSILVNYVITDSNGFTGYSITLGANNSGNNTTTAFITSEPMVPGQQYVFTSEGNVGGGEVAYSELACFTAGSIVSMANGQKDVAKVVAGDVVLTDSGPQVVRWVGRRTVPAVGRFAPIHIAAGTLGEHDDIELSPNHRVLIRDAQAELWFGAPEVLVAAKHLVNGRSVRQMPRGFVTYVHLMFDKHEVITVNGCVSESYYCQGFTSTSPVNAVQAELNALFGDLNVAAMTLIAPEATRHEGRALASAL